jgi:hypothetical protein
VERLLRSTPDPALWSAAIVEGLDSEEPDSIIEMCGAISAAPELLACPAGIRHTLRMLQTRPLPKRAADAVTLAAESLDV